MSTSLYRRGVRGYSELKQCSDSRTTEPYLSIHDTSIKYIKGPVYSRDQQSQKKTLSKYGNLFSPLFWLIPIKLTCRILNKKTRYPPTNKIPIESYIGPMYIANSYFSLHSWIIVVHVKKTMSVWFFSPHQ